MEALVRTDRNCSRGHVVLIGVSAAALVASIPLFLLTVGFNQAQTEATTRAATLYFQELARVLLVVAGLLTVVWLRFRRHLGVTVTGILLIGLVCIELGPIAFHSRSKRRDIWNTDLPAYSAFHQERS